MTWPSRWTLRLDLDGLPGGEHGLAVAALDRGPGGFGAGLAGAAHGQERQVLGQQPGCDGAQDVAVEEQVDAVQVGPGREGAPGQALLEGQGLPPGDDDHRAARRDPDLELDGGAARAPAPAAA